MLATSDTEVYWKLINSSCKYTKVPANCKSDKNTKLFKYVSRCIHR